MTASDDRPSIQVRAQADHSVNALTTQSTGHVMLQLRLTAGAYSDKHLQQTPVSTSLSAVSILCVVNTRLKQNMKVCVSRVG